MSKRFLLFPLLGLSIVACNLQYLGRSEVDIRIGREIPFAHEVRVELNVAGSLVDEIVVPAGTGVFKPEFLAQNSFVSGIVTKSDEPDKEYKFGFTSTIGQPGRYVVEIENVGGVISITCKGNNSLFACKL